MSARRVVSVQAAGLATVAQRFVFHLDGGPIQLTPQTTTVVLNAWESGLAATLHATHPHLVILVYKDISSTRNYPGAVNNGQDAALLPTGVGYEFAAHNRPDWFLLDAHGRHLEWNGYPGHWQMNTANADYQTTWTNNVVSEVRTNHWDGVYIDNALTTADAYHPNVTSPTIPTNTAMQTATYTMLRRVALALHTAGYTIYANIPDARRFPGLWTRWLALLNGAHEEIFAKWSPTPGTGYIWDWDQTGILAQIAELQAGVTAGKPVSVETQGDPTDPLATQYALGCYLLGAGPGTSFQFGKHLSPIPTTYTTLGAPLGPAHNIAAHTWQRDFTYASIIVNIGDTATTAKPHGTFLNAKHQQITTTHLGPYATLILHHT